MSQQKINLTALGGNTTTNQNSQKNEENTTMLDTLSAQSEAKKEPEIKKEEKKCTPALKARFTLNDFNICNKKAEKIEEKPQEEAKGEPEVKAEEKKEIKLGVSLNQIKKEEPQKAEEAKSKETKKDPEVKKEEVNISKIMKEVASKGEEVDTKKEELSSLVSEEEVAISDGDTSINMVVEQKEEIFKNYSANAKQDEKDLKLIEVKDEKEDKKEDVKAVENGKKTEEKVEKNDKKERKTNLKVVKNDEKTTKKGKKSNKKIIIGALAAPALAMFAFAGIYLGVDLNSKNLKTSVTNSNDIIRNEEVNNEESFEDIVTLTKEEIREKKINDFILNTYRKGE